MGANRYTPTTEQVRAHWENVGFAGTGEEFDRWLEQVRAEAKAEALTEAATELNRLDTDVEMYDENLRATQVEWWLRTRAEQIKATP